MNVVNLRSALGPASAMGLDDLSKFWQPEQTCSPESLGGVFPVKGLI